ncbi:MAG TPA: elongation factor G, partial [Gemmatimonadales bacterium]
AQGKYKKQTGGRGQYGDCWLELKPNGQADELAFHNAIVGGAIPRNFVPAIEKGIVESMVKGVIAGFPVIGIDATVYDGSYHDVDSSEMAFKIAGSMAFKAAAQQAKPVILEPIMEVEVVTPADFLGNVVGDLSGRRGKVGGMTQRGDAQVVAAHVPLKEMFGYSTQLRSMTQGRAVYSMEFQHYEEVPKSIAEAIIAKQKA